MLLNFATTNKGKLLTMQTDMKPYGIEVVQKALDIPEPRSNDVQEIADHKAWQALQQLHEPVIVMDAGFYVDSLNGFPRAFTNFALETVGIAGILKLVDGLDRRCEFRECLAYIDKSMNEPKFFIAHIRGSLSAKPRGNLHAGHWSDLALIFEPEGQQATLAEMSMEQLDAWREQSGAKDAHAKEFPVWFLDHQRKG